jgi:hypothetical protein
MDPVSMIVAALAAGAASGLTDAAGSAVRDAYQALRASLKRFFASDQVAETALEQHARNPQAWEGALRDSVQQTGAHRDGNIIAEAQKLLQLVDPDGARTGKYHVNASHAQGVQIGDGDTQYNRFTD